MIKGLDHLVLSVASIEDTVDFYTRFLGMEARRFGAGRTALHFGTHKLNLHQTGSELQPHAHHPGPGTMDLCLLTDRPVAELAAELSAPGIEILEGPVDRTGAQGPLHSIYLRDPDGNLIEIANQY